jgi:XisH protein
MPSEVAYLQLVLGQYLLYRAIIEDVEHGEALYLAVPVHAYNGIFDEYIGQLAIHHFGLKLIIFDIKREAIIKWIP